MASKPPQHLKLGDELDGTVLKAKGGRRFVIKCPAVGRQWDIELHTRRPELIQEGNHVRVWVAKIVVNKAELLVHDGDYGRLPISDVMGPRYVAAIRAVLGEGEANADTLADARAMVIQISKKQQADWLTVWRVLGEPTSGDAKTLLNVIDAMREARKENPDALPELQAMFAERFGEPYRKALARIESNLDA